jgi:hypothetical protein
VAVVTPSMVQWKAATGRRISKKQRDGEVRIGNGQSIGQGRHQFQAWYAALLEIALNGGKDNGQDLVDGAVVVVAVVVAVVVNTNQAQTRTDFGQTMTSLRAAQGGAGKRLEQRMHQFLQQGGMIRAEFENVPPQQDGRQEGEPSILSAITSTQLC